MSFVIEGMNVTNKSLLIIFVSRVYLLEYVFLNFGRMNVSLYRADDLYNKKVTFIAYLRPLD